MRFLMTAVLLCIACLAFAGCGWSPATGSREDFDAETRERRNDFLDLSKYSQETRWAHPYWVEATETSLTIHGNWCPNGWQNTWEIPPNNEWVRHWTNLSDETKPEDYDKVMQHYEGGDTWRRVYFHCDRTR